MTGSAVAFTVQVTDNADYKDIKAYGGGVATPFTIRDIYDQVAMINPAWASKINDKTFVFYVPLYIGDSNGTYYSYIDDADVNVIVSRNILSNQAYAAALFIEGLSGAIDSCSFIATGDDISVKSVFSETLDLAVDNSMFTADNIIVTQSGTDDDTIHMTGCDFYGDVSIDNSGFISAGNKFHDVVELKDFTSSTGDILAATSVLKINGTIPPLTEPVFEDMAIEFAASSKTLNIVNVREITAFNYIKNLTGITASTVNFVVDGVNITVVDKDGVAVGTAAVVIKDKNVATKFSGTTNSSGVAAVTAFNAAVFTLANSGDITSAWTDLAPFSVEITKGSAAKSYGVLSDIYVKSVGYKVDITIISNTKYNGYQIDADSSVSIVNKLHLRRADIWNIRCRIIDDDGTPIDLTSATVSINFFNNAYDTTVFQTAAATSKNANGEALFTIGSTPTALFVNDRYYYNVTVNGRMALTDYAIISN